VGAAFFFSDISGYFLLDQRLMVVGDFDIEGVAILPSETNPKLVVNSNTELTCAIGLQSLQTVTGWNSKIIQSAR
jgi:hypothetical protein